ncbi:hypothetical protein SprV_0802543600 [Sparganum proliferum]
MWPGTLRRRFGHAIHLRPPASGLRDSVLTPGLGGEEEEEEGEEEEEEEEEEVWETLRKSTLTRKSPCLLHLAMQHTVDIFRCDSRITKSKVLTT